MTDPGTTPWLTRAQEFRADDPDPETQTELDALLRAGDTAELQDRFAHRLTFGTAGLRGLLGAGDNRMNRRVVGRTTAGLCAYLRTLANDAQTRGVCIGFDARHKSREFAREAAAIASGAGFVVHAFEDVVPTPLLAFAVLDRAAIGGIMITASHNPAAYNGYKVYLADGAQLGEPHDAAIAQAIERAAPALQLPRLARAQAEQAGLWRSLDGTAERYLARLQAQFSPDLSAAGISVAYSALHGVGEVMARRSLQLAGVTELDSVAGQAQPDPTFPSVTFPNPEEPGALDALLQLAERVHAEIAIANDPDADRLALAVRERASMRVLHGNEIGVLLTDYLLTHAPRDGRNLVVSSIVSTPMVGPLARDHGARWETTLTGFKWIVQRGLALQAVEGLRFVLGFEEALGYCVGDLVHDKDGIAAAGHVARMAAWHKQNGRSLYYALEALYRRYGLHASRQHSLTMSGAAGLARIRASMQRLRSQPPSAIANRRVDARLDALSGVLTRGADKRASGLPSSDVLSFELEDGQRVTVRPSGTEPKLKIYLDAVTPLRTDEPLQSGRERADELLNELQHEFMRVAGLA